MKGIDDIYIYRNRRLKISRDVLKMDHNHYKILHALDKKTMPGPKPKRHLAISLVVHHINHGYHEVASPPAKNANANAQSP